MGGSLGGVARVKQCSDMLGNIFYAGKKIPKGPERCVRKVRKGPKGSERCPSERYLSDPFSRRDLKGELKGC